MGVVITDAIKYSQGKMDHLNGLEKALLQDIKQNEDHYYQIVTFKDLQKLVQSQSDLGQNLLLQRLKDKPFWIWNQEQHKQQDIKTKEDCCFNHIIGLPKKENKEKPMFDYEKLLYDSLALGCQVSKQLKLKMQYPLQKSTTI